MKTVLLFQGGGALSAFGAGAWAALAPRLSPDDELIAVAGASGGAFNAATVIRHRDDPQRCADALQALWARWTMPSLPFFGMGPWPLPPTGGDLDAWSGFSTGLLVGNSGLFGSAPWRWNPFAGLQRMLQPLHQRQGLWELAGELAGHDSRSRGADGQRPPLLAMASVELLSGRLKLFDSDQGPIGAEHLCASSAVPLQFEPVVIDGQPHWDGEITRETMLPVLLQRLLDSGRLAADEPLQLITMEQFPQAMAALPVAGAELMYRAIALAQVGKLDPPALPGLRIERHLRIQREPLPEDGVSGQFDYSPRRIARLMDQGREAVRRALGPLPVPAVEEAEEAPAEVGAADGPLPGGGDNVVPMPPSRAA